ncbi:hypothetical protein Mia14_0952 [Candidatus Mancarchaeum acidiphilum]|uniref:Uncharacterized protein n=1 Tax=Candidatus Mancarchaeum acidiphilum TaxID=1920749 RepID=A0A218NP63_9ARCH|nr:hypothetical protein [Candidatus Mancarchaeum acidiphilum]ASI14224.1 hypothetical protein Mia14_0952 [Candidatus Mancarchaeum acidiphilum]
MGLNESKLIESEIILRNLRLTSEVLETRRSMVRWLAISLGIINPGESRLNAIYVFDAILYFQFNEKSDPSVNDLSEYISKNWSAINEKTLRYHLLQFSNLGLISHSKGKYFLVLPEDAKKYDESEWLGNLIDFKINPIKEKVLTVISELKKR